jgi:hypothetical protein
MSNSRWLGYVHWVVEGQQVDPGADVDAVRPGRERTLHGPRIGQVAVVHHVALRDEDPIEPQLLRDLGDVRLLLPAPDDVLGPRWVLRP